MYIPKFNEETRTPDLHELMRLQPLPGAPFSCDSHGTTSTGTYNAKSARHLRAQ
jgi:hypothetical protein